MVNTILLKKQNGQDNGSKINNMAMEDMKNQINLEILLFSMIDGAMGKG